MSQSTTATISRCEGIEFFLGCMANGRLAGVAIVGRPVSRYLDDGRTLEVNRLCTDGTKNACSFLYGAGGASGEGPGLP
ncbi:MAG: XF1762 family protein [Oscillospiraceae bacterium]